ncbi:glycosyltransferase family 39 protein [Aeromicrobium sp. 50.2.37]|uniref:ArnT family glycosyltransferase n=1 Tax=Aeromicrobium sp. 50.2.37 TaxID=2969305 RepID=UPI00214F9922|nr:glycosyltransferase family 39 protein [Aeromicrobium sp. 50.2.37]MCR4512551.1 glycosyltransferase family 39 protein [Aeromicrobium sp. 50.2.37]
MDQTATMPDTHQTRSAPDASTSHDSASDGPTSREPGFLARAWRGDPADHPAARPALVLLLVGTAALYLWGLGSSGWANSFYSAAAQAGSDSWKAMFFGASDAAGSITVDKTPLSIWVMALSVRLFGLSSWSILVPQALMGVATVALLHATVRRTTGNAWAGLGAGLVLALTPVAVLMFRFNNPDALLVLLLVGATAATLRALEDPRRAARWLALGGALVGLGFLTKMLQAFLVLPALAGVYLLAASVPLARRLVHLVVAFAAMVAAGGWWVLVVELWPASSRPWIGGSQDNSILELTLGYNGLGRLNGNEVGSVGGGGGPGGGGGGWGETGLLRLFSSEIGGQVAWLLPAALLLLVAALWLTLRSGEDRRTRPVTAGLVVWGLWLLVTGLTFSLMAGIFHAYYTVALAPAIGAILGIGGHVLWQHRHTVTAVATAVAVLLSTAAMATVLLGRSDGFLPWLALLVVVLAAISAVAIVLLRFLPARLRRRAGLAVALASIVALLAGPTAYAVDTAGSAHTGSIPSAGPSTGRGGFGAGPGGRRGPGGGQPPQLQDGRTGQGQPPQGAGPQGAPGGTGAAPGNGTGTGTGNQGGAGAGGLLDGSTSSESIDALLTQDAGSYTWVAAAIGSNSASGYQLSTEEPVMAIGGFNGSDPSPTLAQFQQLVADGEVHWFIGGGGAGGRGGPGASGGTSTQIQEWVEETFTATTVDGTTLYDLSGGIA